jgi:arabinose-5-phosphate isomerase
MAAAFFRSLASDQRAVAAVAAELGARPERVAAFASALHRCRGLILPTALGKSAAAAIRLATSLRSLGARAHWTHAAEWGHGDLGMLRADDVLVCISNSGRTRELLDLAAYVRHRRGADGGGDGPAVVSITGDDASPLAALSDVSLECAVPAEHEIEGVLPAGSAVVQDVVVNALLAQLAEWRGASAERLRAAHPGGAIGEAEALRSVGAAAWAEAALPPRR